LPGGFPHSWGSALPNERLDVSRPIAGSLEPCDTDGLKGAGCNQALHRHAGKTENFSRLTLRQKGWALLRFSSHRLGSSASDGSDGLRNAPWSFRWEAKSSANCGLFVASRGLLALEKGAASAACLRRRPFDLPGSSPHRLRLRVIRPAAARAGAGLVRSLLMARHVRNPNCTRGRARPSRRT
jgi:hypothetical protein